MAVPAVHLAGVDFTYPSGVQALSGGSLDVRQGEMLAVVGPNGGGKSTLAKLILGLIKPSAGTVAVFGQTPCEASKAGWVGWVPQRNTAHLGFPISAMQCVCAASRRCTKSVAMRWLEVTGAVDYASRPIGTLSGGQLQRVAIARALAAGGEQGPRLLVLDEPTVGIDAGGQQQFAQLLTHVNKELGVTVLVISHDLRTIASGASGAGRVACVRRSIHYHDAPSGLTPGIIADVFSHDLEEAFGDVHVDAHSARECDEPSHQHCKKRGQP